VRIEVRKSGRCERLLEYLPDRTGAAPVLAVQSRAANRILSPTTTLVAEIEAWAKALGVTRSEALRHLVEIGLKNR
jgi:hypothetical protein